MRKNKLKNIIIKKKNYYILIIIKTDNKKYISKFNEIDLNLIKQHKWSIDSGGYCFSTFNDKFFRLHSLIMGKKSGYVIDHINKNKLDNRRKNLRFLTHIQNCRNR